jgi:signal transduction histidine kinase
VGTVDSGRGLPNGRSPRRLQSRRNGQPGRPSPPTGPGEALLQLSHDVRHSVGTILMLVDASRHELDPDDVTTQFLDGIEFEAGGIAAACRKILVGLPSQCSVRVDDLARQIVKAVSCQFQGTVDLSLEPVSITCDEVALSRLLHNLLQNACHAAGPNGCICVAVRQFARTIWIQVADSGPGFGNVTVEGGLGLAIVQSATEALHGSVTITDDARNRTSVVVTIPVEQPAGRSPTGMLGSSS